MRLEHIRRAVYSTPWAIEESKLEALLEVVELRAEGIRLTSEQIEARVGKVDRPQPQVMGSIAVLPLYGVIAQRMNMVTEMSGGTSTEQFGAMFSEAVNSPDIGAIVLDVDSPGGTVEGVEELSARIHAARGTKPIVALANPLMASAAYWVASAADEVVSAATGRVGSIGVLAMHVDTTKMDEQAGIKRTIIKSGEFKGEGSPHEALTDAARMHMQSIAEEYGDMFVRAVARNRNASLTAVREGYGKGRVFTAQMALKAGMIDRVGTLEDVLERLAGKVSRARRRMSAQHHSLELAEAEARVFE